MSDPTAEVTDLLQHLIRNACVNDGSATSGNEARNADLLGDYFDGSGVDIERYEPAPGRTSLVARIEGRRPDAPRLLLMGHTDVVPVNEDRWRRDPFGGELVDGEVWGRGAVDMLNLTASMAVATRRLAESGFRPDGTLIYLAVADEEALGSLGADHLTRHEADAVARRLRRHRVGRHPDPRRRRGAAAARARGREGVVLVPPAGVRHAGARLAAVPDRQRGGDRGPRGRAARRPPPGHRLRRRVAPVPGGPGAARRAGRPPARRRPASTAPSPSCRSAWPASSTPAPT